MQQATAKLNFLHMAPRKVRWIADTIRNLGIAEAEAQLMLRPHRAAEPLLKLLRSCISNAKNAKMNVDRLFIKTITVDQGPMLKRFLPRAMGRATPIQKKMSHIAIVLEESLEAPKNRYIVLKPKKKDKKEKHTKRKSEIKPTTEKTNKAEKGAQEKPGFLKRIFRRKSV